MWKTTTVLLVLAIGIAILLNQDDRDVPNLPETFWGPERNREASEEIRSFVIEVPKSVIDDLKDRLAKKKELVPPLENTAWTYGTSTTYLENVLEHWRTKYNWTERQALLNKYPQYVTNIQGLDIHFYHVKPHVPSDRNLKVVPLLIVHGWPGSVVEFQKIIPMLTTPRPDRDFVFEVIAPSLPGYGFSQAAVRPGLGPAEMSVIFKNLMLRLGFNKFYVQGGDWGSLIVTHISSLFSDKLPVNVPSACAAFPHEILYHSEVLLRYKYTNLIQHNHLPRGGHFAAMEEPSLLANDIFEFVSKTEDIRKKAENKDIPNRTEKVKEPSKT
ncbi:Juvenile hormone epoxide hydrolase [Ooceraea biroi]|uniref:Epoxide hydrolase n=1 Tax=Ooceraea biroi TaxID=2015173 RepID=A0A026W509_OOCBI|nr:Juvenile hormone epoxide hydrolase [Ooceraea biroi]